MKDIMIIVEGPQGAGKTTFTNYLREKIPATDLYRLTGIKDKTETGYPKIRKKYLKLFYYFVRLCCNLDSFPVKKGRLWMLNQKIVFLLT